MPERVWKTVESALAIKYSFAVISAISENVVEGFQRIPRGGLEVGGVLFGTRRNDEVHIEAWRPITCEHARGPCFLMSDRDQDGLSRLLTGSLMDGALEGLEPVGWFLSHTRREIGLSEDDVEIHNRYFPALWQILLVLKPSKNAPTRAAFFVREPTGAISSHSSDREFLIERQRTSIRERANNKSAAMPAGNGVGPVPLAVVEETGGAAHNSKIPHSRVPVLLWWGLAAITLLAVALAVMYFAQLSPSSGAAPSLGLNAVETNRRMRIQWDGAAIGILKAERGVLEVHDGNSSSQIELQAADLRNGYVLYSRKAAEVKLRLTVFAPGRSPLMEFSHFADSPPENAELLATQKEEVDRLKTETTQLRDKLKAEAQRSKWLNRRNRILSRQLEQR